MDRSGGNTSAEVVPQIITTASSSPIPAPWLDFLDTLQQTPSQTSSTDVNVNTQSFSSYPFLSTADQFPQNTEFINDTGYAYTSPTSTASEPSVPSHQSQEDDAKPTRRRENRYRNAPPSVLSRRRAQNRASQRAYRERKEQRIRDLEQLLEEATQREETLTQAYLSLQTEYENLRVERDESSSLGTTPPLSNDMLPIPYDPASMQQASNIIGGFDFSSNMYQYNDDSNSHTGN